MEVSSAVFYNGLKTRFPSKRFKRLLIYLKAPLIATCIITLLDPIAIRSVFGSTSKNDLILVLLLEGGVGLIASTAIALSSTPSISKVGEMTVGTAPWSRDGEKNAERVASKWVVASTLLILIGFVLSAT